MDVPGLGIKSGGRLYYTGVYEDVWRNALDLGPYVGDVYSITKRGPDFAWCGPGVYVYFNGQPLPFTYQNSACSVNFTEHYLFLTYQDNGSVNGGVSRIDPWQPTSQTIYPSYLTVTPRADRVHGLDDNTLFIQPYSAAAGDVYVLMDWDTETITAPLADIQTSAFNRSTLVRILGQGDVMLHSVNSRRDLQYHTITWRTKGMSSGIVYLDDVIQEILERAGLQSSEFDLSVLSADQVKGIALTLFTPRDVIGALSGVYNFTIKEEDGKLKAYKLGTGTATPIDIENFGAKNG